MNVLITRKLSSVDMQLLTAWNWTAVVAETLDIKLLPLNEIPSGEAWVISSRNSFEAALKFVARAPERVYCVGSWTKESLVHAGIKSTVVSFENMKLLSEALKEKTPEDVVYFCGREHRTELEDGIDPNATKVLKVFTHESRMTFPKVEGKFDAVFVFSPRSAESLLLHNHFGNETVFACVGATTASYVKRRGITRTFVPSRSDSRILLEEFHDQILNSESR